MRPFVAALSVAAVVVGVALVLQTRHDGQAGEGVVSHVRDGDTIELMNGDVVRLVQIDAPELSEEECYAQRARGFLRRLLPPGTRVSVVEDPSLDHVDRYGRRLAYVFKGSANVNRLLVVRGAAGVWFFDGRRGRYAGALVAAERRALERGVGLWRRCPGTPLDPLAPIDSGTR